MIERALDAWPVIVFGLVAAALFIYATRKHSRQMSIAVRGYVRRVATSRWEYGIRSVEDHKLRQVLGYQRSAKAALTAVDRVLRPVHDRRPTS
jgi:hypothetical protein